MCGLLWVESEVDQKSNRQPFAVHKRLNANIKYCLLLSFWSVSRNRLTAKHRHRPFDNNKFHIFSASIYLPLPRQTKRVGGSRSLHIDLLMAPPFTLVSTIRRSTPCESKFAVAAIFEFTWCWHRWPNPTKLQFNKRINYIIWGVRRMRPNEIYFLFQLAALILLFSAAKFNHSNGTQKSRAETTDCFECIGKYLHIVEALVEKSENVSHRLPALYVCELRATA